MYQGWISHTHTHLAGRCPHACNYCAIQDMANHYPALKEKYSGPLRLIEKEFSVNYGTGKTIFMENCNDLFAEDVPFDFIAEVIQHCCSWPKNTYIFQTKNPYRYLPFLHLMPPNHTIGCTIETNRNIPKITKAPKPIERATAMNCLTSQRRFLTLEPLLDFDIDILADWIRRINPEFCNIGADSKSHHLPEPPFEKVMALVDKLKECGIEVREKRNLERLRR